MTVTIGFRASTNDVTFAVYESEGASVLNVEILRVPHSFDLPDALKFVRSNVLDILREFDVQMAGIRTTEPTAKSVNLRRIQIEGVIQEAFASSGVAGFYSGPIATITNRIGLEKDEFKPAVAGENPFDVEEWEDLTENAREALMTAIGAVHV